MATNKRAKNRTRIQGKSGGGGQQAGGNRLRGLTGSAGGRKRTQQSRTFGKQGGKSAH